MSKNRLFQICVAVMLAVLLLHAWQRQQKKTALKKQASLAAKSHIRPGGDQASGGAGGKLQKLQKFKLTGFDDKGKTFWNLEGDAAKIDPQQTIFMDKNVSFRLQNNTIVRTDHVQWIQSEGILLTKAGVTVDHQNAKVSGTGAYGRPNDSFIQLNQNIEMKIEPATTVTCRGPLKIYYGENKMMFYRSVRVNDEHGILLADRMEVTFDEQNKKVKEILAVGKVVIERGSDTTRSERAIYTPSNGSIRLEGSPEVSLHQKGAGFLDGTFTN